MSKTDFSFLGLERILKLALPSIVTFATAKQLGADAYGSLVWVLGIAGLLQPITTLGANQLIQVLTKSFSSLEHSKKILWAGVKLQVIGSLIAFPIYGTLISKSSENNLRFMLLIIWLAGLLQSGEVAEFWLLGLGKIKNAAKPSILSILTNAALKFSGVLADLTPIYYCTATAVGSLLKTIYFGAQINIFKVWRRCKVNNIVKLTKFDLYVGRRSVYYSLSGLSVSIYVQSDIVMLGLMDKKEVVGAYSLICLIASACTSIASVAPNYIFSKHSLKDPKSVNILFLSSFISSFIFSILYIIISIAAILYLSEGYQIGYYSIFILTPMVYMGTMGSALAYYQGIERLESSALWNTASGAAANIVLNLVLIPRFSLNGAAIAFTISTFVSSYITPWFNRTSKSSYYKKFINPF